MRLHRKQEEKNMSVFTGAGVAIATPFYADGAVNYEEFARLIEFQIAQGTDAIVGYTILH
jgi:4-hydroxy-tetrahydrodipicolinate synthase